jgi:hypothetical protein
MSEQLTKEELIRMAWITALRRDGGRQCDGQFIAKGNRVCALGLLGEVAGLSRRQIRHTRWMHKIGELGGLSYEETEIVWQGNDDGCTFAEIADVVEGWFSQSADREVSSQGGG